MVDGTSIFGRTYVGTLGGTDWRLVQSPRIGARTTAKTAFAPDDLYAVTVYNAMGSEAGGEPVAFVRKEFATGAVRTLPGRAAMPEEIVVSDGGIKALIYETSPPRLSVRHLGSGVETSIPLDGRTPSAFDLSPNGAEVVMTFDPAEGEDLGRIVRWSAATGLVELPMPEFMVRPTHVSLANKKVAVLGVDGFLGRVCLYIGPLDGSAWIDAVLFSDGVGENVSLARDGNVFSFYHPRSSSYTIEVGSLDGTVGGVFDLGEEGGALSRDGRWVVPLAPSNLGILNVATGMSASLEPPRGEASTLDFVGPWRLPVPFAYATETLPIAYRATVLRHPEFRLSSFARGAGKVSITATVTKAGIENAPHRVFYRANEGSWQSSATDRFEATFPLGPQEIDVYVEDSLGRRSETRRRRVVVN